jgi:hypothetical protein
VSRRRWLPWVLIGSLLLVWLLIAVVVRLDDRAGSSNDLAVDHTILIDDDHLAVQLTVPAGTGGISDIRTDPRLPDCLLPTYGLNGQPGLEIELVPADCRLPAGANQQIGNGNHGTYRRLDDVPNPIDVQHLSTKVGPAVIFTQKYFEATNSVARWQEPVAIVNLDHPADPHYPTLVLRGYRDEVSRSQLRDMVSSLEPIS